MEPVSATATWTFATFVAGSVVGGILGNRSDAAYCDARRLFFDSLLAEADPDDLNHDVETALLDATRDATVWVASQLRDGDAPPPKTSVGRCWRSLRFYLGRSTRRSRWLSDLFSDLRDDRVERLQGDRGESSLHRFLRRYRPPSASEAEEVEPAASESPLSFLADPALADAIVRDGVSAWLDRRIVIPPEPDVADELFRRIRGNVRGDRAKVATPLTFPALVQLHFMERIKRDVAVRAAVSLAFEIAQRKSLTRIETQLKARSSADFEDAVERLLEDEYRRYELDRASILEALSDVRESVEAGREENRVAFAENREQHQTTHDKLDQVQSIITELKPTAVGVSKTEHSAAVEKDPRPPVRCFGREEDVVRISAWLDSDISGPACIHGAAGIGKSTVAAQALCEKSVQANFGERRAVIRCDHLGDADVVLRAIATAAALDARSDVSAVKANCHKRPIAIILDNAETPWVSDREGMVRLVQMLGTSPGVRLLCCIRRNTAPNDVKWSKGFPIKQLSRSAAVDAFLDTLADADESCEIKDSILSQGEGARERLGDFLEQKLDCVPLAVNLVASAARSLTTLDEVVAEWNRIGHELAKHSDGGEGRHDSLEHAYELSIRRLNQSPEALEWLGALSRLPDGLSDTMRATIGGDGTSEVFRLLRELALLQRLPEQGRDRMLAPLREYVRRKYGQATPMLRRLRSAYFELASQGRDAGTERMVSVRRLIAEEATNIEAVLLDAIESFPTVPA